MDFDALRQHAREIEKILERFSVGYTNEDALTGIRHVSLTIRRSCEGNPDIIEKVRRVEVFASVMYSEERMERYRGPDAVMMIVRNELAGLRFHISRLERLAESHQ